MLNITCDSPEVAIPGGRHGRRARHGAAALYIALAALATPALRLEAQSGPLSLRDALRIAERRAYANRTAVASADAARAQATSALRGVLPALATEAGVVRTTDPVGAFGVALRQRGVSQASFAPAALNHPAAITNVGASVTFEQPLVNADAWLGLRAARAGASAADAAARWTATTVRSDVVQAYYGGVLAREVVRALAAAERSALEHVRLAELAAVNGIVTNSDALLARVRAGEVTVQRIDAESKARLALAGLATLLGLPADTAVSLPEVMPDPESVAALGEPAAAAEGERDDLRAARQARGAARLDIRRAQGSLLPRINGFARYDWNSPSRVGGGAPAWTVGAAAQWSVFSGGRELADVHGAAARARAADAQVAAAEAAAALERRAADEALAVAIARAAIADTAVLQSAEALRIVRKKYDGGLATMSELLDAGAAETQSRLALADARYRVIVAATLRLRARGADPGAMAAIDPNSR